jgi:membrane protein
MPKADPAPTTTPPAGFLEASWSPEALAERGWRGASKSAWRVIATTWHGVVAHRLPQQSAALTYYTLMSLGPLLGLALTVSGFILSRAGDQQDNPAKRAIVAAVEYAAPQIVAKASAEGHHATLREINKDLDALVDRLLKTAASGEAGVIGLLLLFGLAVLMLSRVEDALNGIWGVRFGRSWRDRFANYLLFLVVFFLVGATTLTMLSAASLAASFGAGATWLTGWLQKIPGGGWFADFVGGGGPLFVSLALLTLAFAAFNRMMPNARVRWSAALVGGLAIAVLVVCNHRLAALYVGKVTELQSLYGELSIVLVLLFGTYLSWLFVLIGGQVAYAYQNRRTLARHKSWEALSHRARRTLAFLCVAETLRRSRAGRPGPTAEDIGVSARVPASVAEGCLEMLRETGLLALESRTGGHKPARPLEAMTIGQFWGVVDEHATGRAGDLDLSADPAAREHAEIEGRLRVLPGAGVTLGELSARGQGHACS